MVKLDYLPPPGGLAEYLSTFYLFESDESALEDIERADVAQIRIHLQGSGRVIYADGHEQALPKAALMGPRLAASRIVAIGDPAMRMIGVGLLPAGWATLVQRPAFEYADKVVDLAELAANTKPDYGAKLAGVTTLSAMLAVLADMAGDLNVEPSRSPRWFIRIVDEWLESALAPDLASLECATSLSRRQIERLCNQYYGAPPKYLVRKYRALRSANAIANGQGSWQDFIDDAYYDQPHFIREIKHFTGLTPSAIRDAHSRISHLTFGRARLAGEVMPLVSLT